MNAVKPRAWHWYLCHQDAAGMACAVLVITALVVTPVAAWSRTSPWLLFAAVAGAEAGGAAVVALVIWLARTRIGRKQ